MFGVGPFYVSVIIAITVGAVILGHQPFTETGIISALRIFSLIIGIILVILGILLWFSAVNYSRIDDNIEENKLVTTGIYGFVRNPIYSAFMFLCTGALFISGNIFFYPLFFFYWGFMTLLMINTEEKWLEAVYGSQYTEYQKKVNRCIPWKRK